MNARFVKQPRARLTLSAELPDFDLRTASYLLRQADQAILLGDTPLRARYHGSLTESSSWPAGTTMPIEWTASPFWVIPSGTR